MRKAVLVLTLALAATIPSAGLLQAQQGTSPQGLDELARRKARLATASWPHAKLEDAYDKLDWAPETLCFTDVRTGREVWRLTATPDVRNYYHNDIAVSPWSADGRRMAFQSWRARTGREVRVLWMVVDTTGRRLRPTVNSEAYMHWSPLLPDVYYTFGGARFLGDTGTNNILYKVTVSDEDARAMKPLITYPVVKGASYGNRKFISSDGKTWVAFLSDASQGWDKYQIYFIPSVIYPDAEARPLLEKGYTVNRDFGDYLAKPYTKGRYHDAYLLGDGTWYYAIDREIGYWRIRTLGSAPDGGAKFTGDDGNHNFGEIIPEYVRKLGKRDDPWKENQFPGHPGFDRWGEMVNIANYDSVDEKGDFKIGCTVYDFLNHRPVTGSWIPQTDGSVHCDWHAWADWCVVSIEQGKYAYGDARIECFPYDQRGKNFIVCYTHNFTNGGKDYYNYIRPAQSPDGTKVAFHSDMLNSKAAPDCYWAVCTYPKPPTDLKAEDAPGGVKLTWKMPTYTKRGWPTKNDPPPPAREIKAFHVWVAATADGPWTETGKVDVQYEANADRSIMEPKNLAFVQPVVQGVHYYAVTTEEYSGLESRELSEVLKVTLAVYRRYNYRRMSTHVAAPAGRKDFHKKAPLAPTAFKAVKTDTLAHYQLSWNEPDDDKVRYTNVYYAAGRDPEAKQANRIASLPRGTTTYLDWLADPDVNGHYAITSVDRQGNESPPARPK